MKVSCCFHQALRGVWADRGRPLPAFCVRHLLACPACRTEHQSEREVARRLGAEAVGWRQPAPPGLSTLILGSLPPPDPRATRLTDATALGVLLNPAAEGPGGWRARLASGLVGMVRRVWRGQHRELAPWRLAWGNACGLLLLTLLGTWLVLHRSPPSGAVRPPALAFARATEELWPDTLRFPSNSWVSVSQTLDHPLENELQSVVSDATNVAHWLARDFLPNTPP